MNPWTRRDLTIVPLAGQSSLVIACDSCGGIGVKEGDAFKLPPRIAGQFTARVALTEVLCSGAVPVTITNGVACEMDPTGREVILGIQDELRHAGLNDVVLTGSTEENFPTSMTALAITVVGVAQEGALKFGCAVRGDTLILLGHPCVGAEVDLESEGFYDQIRQLMSMPGVREIVPVGSKGVAFEAETLAALNGMSVVLNDTGIDYHKSAGPATCLLVLCAESSVNHILSLCPLGFIVGMTL
jgi:hypothetical protein